MKINRGIPLPPRSKYGAIYSILLDLRQGDCILIARKSYDSVWKFAKRKGIKITSRKEDGIFIRIWRLTKGEPK